MLTSLPHHAALVLASLAASAFALPHVPHAPLPAAVTHRGAAYTLTNGYVSVTVSTGAYKYAA